MPGWHDQLLARINYHREQSLFLDEKMVIASPIGNISGLIALSRVV